MVGSDLSHHGQTRPWRRSSPVSGTPPFVGRRAAQEWIEGCLNDAGAGRSRVVLVEGPVGMGKTRLLRELQTLARGLGLVVCAGRCSQDLELPYSPFEPLLGRLRGELEGFDGAPLSEDDGTTPDDRPADERARWLRAVVRAAIGLARRRTLVISVDDLQWADEASLRLFAHLIYAAASASLEAPVRMLVCANFRSVETSHPLARVLEGVRREPIAELLELTGLELGDVHVLLRSLGMGRPSEQLALTLMDTTGGNPLLILELLRHLEREGSLVERGGQIMTTVSAESLHLPEPESGRAVALVDELDDGCREILYLASFLGESFSLELLAAATGKTREDLLNRLEDAFECDLLVEEGEHCHFAHPAVRRRLYDARASVVRRRIHCRIATTLKSASAGQGDEFLLEIAHHLAEAGSSADPAERLAYARRAGDRAFRLAASPQAARFYEVALEAATALPSVSEGDRAELHFRTGLSYYRVGDAGLALHHYERAEEIFRSAGDDAGVAAALREITRTHYTLASVTYGSLIDTSRLERALDALGDTDLALRARILVTLSEVAWTALEPKRAVELGARAFEIADQIDDAYLAAEADRCLALAHVQRLEIREAFSCYRRGLRAADRAGDPFLEGALYQRVPLVLLWLGRIDEALQEVENAVALMPQTDDWAGHSHTLAVDTLLALACGNFETVEKRCRETMTMVRRSGYPWGGVLALQGLACARALQGHFSAAEDALDTLMKPGRVFREVGSAIQVLTSVYRNLLSDPEALDPELTDSLLKLVSALPSAIVTDTHSLAGFCALVELAVRLREPRLAARAVPVLERASSNGVLVTSGWVFLIQRVWGLAARVLGDDAEATRHFEAALDQASRIGARPEFARTAFDYAQLLAERVERGDESVRGRARALAKQALASFGALGMTPWQRQAEQLAIALGEEIAASKPAPTRRVADLSSTERVLLREAVRGRPWEEISEELLLHPDTVRAWVDRLFEQIGHSTDRPATADARGLLVLLVTDLEGFTPLINRVGDQRAQKLMKIHNRILRHCLKVQGGREVTHTGDGLIATFTSAGTAIDCALEIQRLLASERKRTKDFTLRVRIGLDAGEPLPEEDRLRGAAVNAAVRIGARAKPNQILVSDVVRQLARGRQLSFREHGRFRLKGFSERFRLFEVESDTSESE
jgi:class 3 adenylate cyclase/tetratricopeptide (TPR) repeat protein